MDEPKAFFDERILAPLKDPAAAKRLGVQLPSGVILAGPKGCGKTLLASALAEELAMQYQWNVYEVSIPDIASSKIHELSKNFNEIYETAKKNAPSVIIINEIDTFLNERSGLRSDQEYKKEEVNSLLKHLEEAADNRILFLGTTNFPHILDSAAIRPGRLFVLDVSMPDLEAREEIFSLGLSERSSGVDINLSVLAEATDGFSGADIVKGILAEAASKALKLKKTEIDQELLLDAIKTFRDRRQRQQAAKDGLIQ